MTSRRVWIPALLLAVLGAAWLLSRAIRQAEDASADAVAAARASLAEAERTHGAASRPVAAALDELVAALYSSGHATEDATLEYARRAVDLKRAILEPQHPRIAKSLTNLGAALFERGELAAAKQAFEDALRIRRRQPEALLPLQECVHNLALATKETGDLATARILFDESVNLLETAGGKGSPVRRARSWNDYGLLLHELGDFSEAQQAFEKAREYSRDHRGELANVLHSLGRLHHDAKDYRSAKACFDEALAIVEDLPVVQPRWKAALLNNAGWLYHETGDVETARTYYEEALRLREESGEPSPHTAWTLSNLALLDMSAGRLGEARSRLDRALALRRRFFEPRHPLLVHSLSYAAVLALLEGDSDTGLQLALEAEEIRRRGLLLTLPVLEERRGLLLKSLEVFGIESTSLDLELSSLLANESPSSETVALVWDDVVRSRGLLLDESAERARLRRAGADPRVRSLVEKLTAARQRLADLFVRGASNAELDRLRREVEEAEFSLARIHHAVRSPDARARLGWPEVVEALERRPSGSVLVAFVQYERFEGMRRGKAHVVPSYLAFVCESQEKLPRAVELGPAAELESAVERWRSEVLEAASGTEASDGDVAGRELRRLVWDPLFDVLDEPARVERVCVVPEGALHTVSFAGLPSAGGGYLVENGPLIHYLSAEKDLPVFAGEDDESRTTGEGLLALGVDAFGDLPSTESEVRNIAAIVAGRASQREGDRGGRTGNGSTAEVLTGREASEAAFKRLAPGRRVVHLATHGFFLEGSQAENGRAVAERFRGLAVALSAAEPAGVGAVDPLLLSGLVLADANTERAGTARVAGEDGVLLAEEIASLDLAGVEWAVLSACETGLGEVHASEGIFGLRRAFRLAGAASLILSLWRVEDEATKEWMTALYRARFEKGLDTAAAVRRASLDLIAKRRAEGRPAAPFYWAGFVATGDWR